MNCDTLRELKQVIEKEIEDIWVTEPKDIYNIKNGYLGSEAGVYDQYFTPLVMLSGEVRALGIHTFSSLLDFSEKSEFTLDILKTMTKRMLKIDVGVIEFFGLKKYGRILTSFHDLVDSIEDKEEFKDMITLMFTLTNRYQMWLHQIFPWGYCMHMPKQGPKDYKEIYENMVE
ncbi:MAG: hypothetical protein GX329_07810 [Tissierellia bacterium]|nr:hypothetical protein [Tissierellia bacterium]